MNSHSKSQRIAFYRPLGGGDRAHWPAASSASSTRTSASGEQMLSDMRLTALLTTAGEGSKEALVEAEVEAAREAARAAGGGLSEIKEAVAAAEAAAMERVANMTVEVDLDTVDTSALIPRWKICSRRSALWASRPTRTRPPMPKMMAGAGPGRGRRRGRILEDAPADAEAAMDMDMSEDEMMLEERRARSGHVRLRGDGGNERSFRRGG